MKITGQDNYINFKGIHIATARPMLKNVGASPLELYKLTNNDKKFTSDLFNNINLERLYPGLDFDKYKLWYRFIKQALTETWNSQPIIVTQDNIPCGAINFKKNRVYDILSRATWPINSGERVSFAGKALTLELFNIFLNDKDNVNAIRTNVVRAGVFDTITKCMELGFRSRGGDNYNEQMGISRSSVEKIVEKFRPIIEINEHNSEDDLDLSKILKLKKEEH